jgi:hypothetical protein
MFELPRPLLFSFFLFLTLPTIATSQIYERHKDEDVEAFTMRIKPVEEDSTQPLFGICGWNDTLYCVGGSTKLTHPILQTSWNGLKNVLFVAYGKEYKDGIFGNNVGAFAVWYLLIPVSDRKYRRILVDTMPPSLEEPEKLEAVFYVNADKDSELELAILFSLNLNPSFNRTYYDTRFYDNLSKSQENRLTPLQNVGDFSGCDCYIDGVDESAKYKTARAVRRRLKRLGY